MCPIRRKRAPDLPNLSSLSLALRKSKEQDDDSDYIPVFAKGNDPERFTVDIYKRIGGRQRSFCQVFFRSVGCEDSVRQRSRKIHNLLWHWKPSVALYSKAHRLYLTQENESRKSSPFMIERLPFKKKISKKKGIEWGSSMLHILY